MDPNQKTTTAAQTSAPVAPINGGSPLARPETPVDGSLVPNSVETIVWTRERIDLIKREICPAGITDSEFAMFIERCKRAGMDPLMDEAYCVPRRVKVVVGQDDRGYDIERWVNKHVFQGAEKGMAARADRFPDFRGIKSSAVHEKDIFEIDAEAGVVVHKFKPNAERGKLIGAWAHCLREGRVTPVVWLPFSEYVQTTKDGKTTSMWAGKPETMMEKCARATAYRRAYPNTFGGVYIKEEEREEREVNAPPRTVEQERNGGQTRTERITQKVQSRAGGQTVEASNEPIAVFGGELKNRKLSSLTDEQLSGLIHLGNETLAANPNESWVPKMKANLVEIQAEVQKRIASRPQQTAAAEEPPPPAEREPGDDREDGMP